MDLNEIRMEGTEHLSQGDALVVVDMQNDFMPGGMLAVSGGDSIIPGVNSVMKLFYRTDLPVILTQDWHPSGHHSFASAHEGKNPFDSIDAPGIGPILWPDHCVVGSPGADFHPDLDTQSAHAIIRKGYHTGVDSYSGFTENDRITPTGLDGYLKAREVTRVFLCGLALDYCVFFTASDAADLGYAVFFIADLTQPVASPPDSVSNALETMTRKGVRFIRAESIRG